ncbi:MAG TPA: hypothetical protein DCK98_16535 [Chloroflexi bacterium]|jgi:hypothetical protein|nr:hypothetical protein [Chloroflexota bacterium]HAL27177.1 hypothetical protein [Chloroflexota bacterium]
MGRRRSQQQFGRVLTVNSKTTDGGTSWTTPTTVSPFKYNQGSVLFVDAFGTMQVTYIAFSRSHNVVASSSSTDGGATFTTNILATINAIPSPLPGGTFRTTACRRSPFPEHRCHVVWANWNGANADVL